MRLVIMYWTVQVLTSINLSVSLLGPPWATEGRRVGQKCQGYTREAEKAALLSF